MLSGLLTVLQVMLKVKVTWVKVKGHTRKAKGHMVQGQHKGHDIGRWAHINVKLLHLEKRAQPNNEPLG